MTPSWSYHLELALERVMARHKNDFSYVAFDELADVTDEQWKYLLSRIMTPLAENEISQLKTQVEELKSVRETNDELRKLVVLAVAEIRHMAKTAEDLGIQMYDKASFIQDKLRTL